MKFYVSSRFTGLMAYILILGITSSITSCNDSEIQDKVDKAHDNQLSNAISEMAKRHKAISDWEDELDIFPLTIKVKEVLVNKEKRPILFDGYLNDIVQHGDVFFVHFTGGILTNFLFILKADPNQVRGLIGNKPNLISDFAVVALISSVRRPLFDVKASEFGEIYLDENSTFIAEGVMLDFLYWGDGNKN